MAGWQRWDREQAGNGLVSMAAEVVAGGGCDALPCAAVMKVCE